MKKIQILLLTIVVATLASRAQYDVGARRPDGRFIGNGHTVVLDYRCQDKQSIFLRIQNDMKWAVAVRSDNLYYRTGKTVKLENGRTFFSLPTDKPIELQYYVEQFGPLQDGHTIPQLARPDSGSINWIAPRESVYFSVPFRFLRDDLQISVNFKYEWEMDEHGLFETSPEHKVFFRGIDLPDKPTSCGTIR